MSGAGKASFSLKEIGPGTDLESYTSQNNGRKSNTEVKLNDHLQGLLKDGIEEPVETDSERLGLTYGHSILAAVVYEKYDMALKELDTLMGIKVEYPSFGEKASRYISHAKSLVRAIKAKRAIGKLPHVSRSKQKELVGALTIHFRELRACILNIEKVERYVRKEDIGSTRWFMLSLFWSVFAVFVVALFYACFPDVFVSIHSLLTDYLHQLFSWLAKLIWPI